VDRWLALRPLSALLGSFTYCSGSGPRRRANPELHEEIQPREIFQPPRVKVALRPLLADGLHPVVGQISLRERRAPKLEKHPHRRRPFLVELADACIRIFDLAGVLGYDLGGAVVEKDAFNSVRPDHKIETRKLAGGKAY